MKGNEADKNLFEAEREVLRCATALISDKRYGDNILLPKYLELVEEYEKLLKTTRKIFRMSDIQGYMLQKHRQEVQNLLDHANQGFLTFGPDLLVDGRYSAECTRIFGRKIFGESLLVLLEQQEGSEMIEVLRRSFTCKEETRAALWQKIPSQLKLNQKDVRIECKYIAQPEDEADPSLIMMILTDITDKLRAEEQIRYLSYHDKLTSLYNRAYVEMAIQGMEKQEVLPLSTIVIDINGLKLTNDVFGHEQGDRILVAMARTLTGSCRKNDIIARWGGDEFLVLLPRTGEDICQKVCERIRLACNEVSDTPIPLSAAFGMATKNEGGIHLSEIFGVAESRMYNDKLLGSREARRKIITRLETMINEDCYESTGHCARVKDLAAQFAKYLGLSSEDPDLGLLSQLADLHDIGKVALPRDMLGKSGPLTADEWKIVKSHSDIGYRMAQSIGEQALADIILAHHERWDGLGYPQGLKGEKIPFLVRLFSLVDVYDIMTHSRPYQGAKDIKDALREIKACSGSQFDPVLAEQFIKFTCEKQGISADSSIYSEIMGVVKNC